MSKFVDYTAFLVFWNLYAVYPEVRCRFVLFEKRGRELKRKHVLTLIFHALLHVCDSRKALCVKAWKTLRRVSLCRLKFAETVLYFYVGFV